MKKINPSETSPDEWKCRFIENIKIRSTYIKKAEKKIGNKLSTSVDSNLLEHRTKTPENINFKITTNLKNNSRFNNSDYSIKISLPIANHESLSSNILKNMCLPYSVCAASRIIHQSQLL